MIVANYISVSTLSDVGIWLGLKLSPDQARVEVIFLSSMNVNRDKVCDAHFTFHLVY